MKKCTLIMTKILLHPNLQSKIYFGTLNVHRQNGQAILENAYPEVVCMQGNQYAQRLMQQAFDIVDAPWRGIGTIPASAYILSAAHQHRDAHHHFPVNSAGRKRAWQMPPGCDCAAVLLAKKTPQQCPLFDKACTPDRPLGPCMVSDEGACHIWWSAGLR